MKTITDISFIASPNYNERPQTKVSLIVVHNISLPPDVYGGCFIEQFFCNQLDPKQHPYFQTIKDLKVSAHLLIKRTGEVIQFVPFDKRAWHAGKSMYQGRENCNDFSIGIELEGSDSVEYTDFQYKKLNQMINLLKQYYPITDVVGHHEISPRRKTDPGVAFDWQRIEIKK